MSHREHHRLRLPIARLSGVEASAPDVEQQPDRYGRRVPVPCQIAAAPERAVLRRPDRGELGLPVHIRRTTLLRVAGTGAGSFQPRARGSRSGFAGGQSVTAVAGSERGGERAEAGVGATHPGGGQDASRDRPPGDQLLPPLPGAVGQQQHPHSHGNARRPRSSSPCLNRHRAYCHFGAVANWLSTDL
jgi:hypothetical protein